MFGTNLVFKGLNAEWYMQYKSEAIKKSIKLAKNTN